VTALIDQAAEFERLTGRPPSDAEVVLMARAKLDAADYVALAAAIAVLGTLSKLPGGCAGCVVFGALVHDREHQAALLETTRGRPGLADGLRLLAGLIDDAVTAELDDLERMP
jgi:hypothetical protein